MNYTKGKWNYEPCLLGHPDNAINIVVKSSNGNSIARIFSEDATLSGMTSLAPCRKIALANTYLISAAPDMYEALEGILTARNSALAREAGRKALAKAEGKDNVDPR